MRHAGAVYLKVDEVDHARLAVEKKELIERVASLQGVAEVVTPLAVNRGRAAHLQESAPLPRRTRFLP
jgi:hypothetical protein